MNQPRYQTKRFTAGHGWGGMYDYSARFETDAAARLDTMWAERERHNKPVVLLKIEDDTHTTVIDCWTPPGTVLPSTYGI